MNDDEEDLRFWGIFSGVWCVFVVFALLMLMFSSCGAPFYSEPLCETRCGLRLQNLPLPLEGQREAWSCESLQTAEDEIEFSFRHYSLDARVTNYCSRIAGWRVGVMPVREWYSETHGYAIAGATYCASSLVVVNNWQPDRTSLPHELIHALQDCTPLPPGTDQHANWDRDGLYRAIMDVNRKGYDRTGGEL